MRIPNVHLLTMPSIQKTGPSQVGIDRFQGFCTISRVLHYPIARSHLRNHDNGTPLREAAALSRDDEVAAAAVNGSSESRPNGLAALSRWKAI